MQYSIYRCDLTLHDYLFFASTERGKVAETSPFVHNYALTYALSWVQTAWHNEQQKARYHEDLTPVRHHYITPAKLMRGASIVMQYNTLSEQLKFEKQRGKFMAKTKIDVVEARSVLEKDGNFTVSHLLNWSDLRKKPVAFNVRAMSLPTRLISQAVFEAAEFLEARFHDGDEIRLPLEMGYLLDM